MITVIIPTYNPSIERLNQTLKGLANQTLSFSEWEIIVIDNNSQKKFGDYIDLKWHPKAGIVFEGKQGLSFARLKGIEESKGDIIVMVDDDNILDATYLENCLKIFDTNLKLGSIGGKSVPLFEANPSTHIKAFYGLLALRDLGNEIQIESFSNQYPTCAPIGAGMAFRKEAILKYRDKILNSKAVLSDRKGNSLSSSGDNDMVMEIVKAGWEVGYFPQLSLQHIIPESRTTVEYLSRLNFGIQKSWVQFLWSHNISPWNKISKYSVQLRKLKAWFSYKAYQSEVKYIKWKGSCGMFEGLTK